jgi:hypothetical protein
MQSVSAILISLASFCYLCMAIAHNHDALHFKVDQESGFFIEIKKAALTGGQIEGKIIYCPASALPVFPAEPAMILMVPSACRAFTVFCTASVKKTFSPAGSIARLAAVTFPPAGLKGSLYVTMVPLPVGGVVGTWPKWPGAFGASTVTAKVASSSSVGSWL